MKQEFQWGEDKDLFFVLFSRRGLRVDFEFFFLSAFVRSLLPPEGKKENCSHLLPQDRFNRTPKISSSSSFCFWNCCCVESLFALSLLESIHLIKKEHLETWKLLTFSARQCRYYLMGKNDLLNRVTFLDITYPPFSLYSSVSYDVWTSRKAHETVCGIILGPLNSVVTLCVYAVT